MGWVNDQSVNVSRGVGPLSSIGQALEAYPADGPTGLRLDRVVARAFCSSLLRRKLERGGLRPGESFGWSEWQAIPPTTKDELRALADFENELCVVPRERVVEYWRSGGVTGRPLFYPRTAYDIEQSLGTFERCLRFAGVTGSDVFMGSLPLGIHPAGQQTMRAAERIGAATVWSGAGNQTASAAQIELVHDLGVTVWCGMASFGLHLAHLAEAGGTPLRESAVRLVITTAEILSRSKRTLLERLWGARVVDVFGMSEIGLMGVECGRRPGLHVWSDYSFCEVLHPESLLPQPLGEVGVLCVTPLGGGEAVPFVRWLSGDLVRLELDCECEAARHPRLVLSGRTLNFFKVKGVNVNHAEVEDALYDVPSLLDFRVLVTDGDRLVVELEAAEGQGRSVCEGVAGLFRERFGLRADVALLERGGIARSVEGQLKAQRFVDQR